MTLCRGKGREITFFYTWVQTITNDMNVRPSLQIKNIKLELIRC